MPPLFHVTFFFDSIAFRDASTLVVATKVGTTQPLRIVSLDSYGAHLTQTGDYLAGSDVSAIVGKS